MSDARALTLALRGKWYGRYGLACCPAHGDRKPSLTLAYASDGRLLLNCKTGCSFREVLAALRERGLMDPHHSRQAPSPVEVARRKADDEVAAVKREKQALAVWRKALPISGTIAEIYLRGRGITCPLSASLRFHPACWHVSARRLPALVARVDGLSHLAVHRTYLSPNGTGKAEVKPSKAMLGATMSGAVRLVDGQGPLVVAEGIETALSLASGLLRGPSIVWAALSAPGIAGLRLPNGDPHKLIIAPDSDDKGASRDAAHKLAERASALGWSVSLLPAPEGRDWNDILIMKGAAV